MESRREIKGALVRLRPDRFAADSMPMTHLADDVFEVLGEERRGFVAVMSIFDDRVRGFHRDALDVVASVEQAPKMGAALRAKRELHERSLEAVMSAVGAMP